MKSLFNSLFTTTALLALVTSAPGCAGKKTRPGEPPRKATEPFVGDYKVQRYVLDNGLKLLVIEDHSSPTFAYQTWYDVGSRNEEPGRTGLAHLFEHMMFKETRNLKEGEFDRTLEAIGAEGLNAFTSRDYTAYIQELPVGNLDLIARLEAERMSNLVIDEKAFKTETEVVQNERRSRTENNPGGQMYEELFNLAFRQHPYKWPVIGSQEDLNAMTAEDARAFYRSFYSPENATITVVGDVDAGDVHDTIKKHYGKLQNQPRQDRTIPEEPPQTSARRKRMKLSIQVEKLMMGYRTPSITHEDIPALEVLSAVLTGGNSSRLNRALVDTGIAGSVGAFQMEDKDPSLFVISANLQKKRRAALAESVILRELARIAKEGVSEQEIQRAKNIINFAFYEGLESNSEKANFLGEYATLAGNYRFGIELHQKIQNVTPGQIQAVVKQYFQPGNRSVVTGAPK